MADKVGENPAALRAAVFLLLAKNRRGGVQTPPSRAKVKRDRLNKIDYSGLIKLWKLEKILLRTIAVARAYTFWR